MLVEKKCSTGILEQFVFQHIDELSDNELQCEVLNLM